MLAWKEPAQKGKKNKNDEEFAEALPEISLTLICREWSLQITLVVNYAFQIEDIQRLSNDCDYIYIYMRDKFTTTHWNTSFRCVYIFSCQVQPKKAKKIEKGSEPAEAKLH